MPTAPRHVAANADPALLKALGRAFRWNQLHNGGTFASVFNTDRAEKLDRTYVGDMLRLTLLAPEIVVQIVNGRQADDVTLQGLMKPFPKGWLKQTWTIGSD